MIPVSFSFFLSFFIFRFYVMLFILLLFIFISLLFYLFTFFMKITFIFSYVPECSGVPGFIDAGWSVCGSESVLSVISFTVSSL